MFQAKVGDFVVLLFWFAPGFCGFGTNIGASLSASMRTGPAA